MLKWLMELELKDCVKLISNMMIENGIALNDIITDIHNQGKYSSKINQHVTVFTYAKTNFN